MLRCIPPATTAPRLAASATLLFLFATASAPAAVFTVGTPVGPGQCTHGTIQSAINAAESSPGADTVRLTRSLTYEPEANSVNTAQELTIEGGYANCTAAFDGTYTTVSGAGGATEPVFRITGNTGALIRLRYLTISGGDEDGAGKGGGIYFRGDGLLDVSNSNIRQNTAGNGGGIYAEGTGTNAELAIGANVNVSNNIARYNGGGIVADQIEMTMLTSDSAIFFNEAQGLGGTGGRGGGLYVYSAGLSSYATIGSGSSLGAIFGNRALYGGGAAVGGSPSGNGPTSLLKVYATAAGRPAVLSGNIASVAGGGIYVRSEDSLTSGGVFSRAQLFNASLQNNSAPQGAAVQVQGSDTAVLVEEYAEFTFNSGSWPGDAAPCAVDVPCGRIVNNTAEDAGGQPTQGAILNAEHDTFLQLGSLGRGIFLQGNRGGRLIAASTGDGYSPVALRAALVTGNTVSQQLIQASGGDVLAVTDCTITGNLVSGSSVLAATDKDVQLLRSILWQPGVSLLSRSGGSLSTGSIDASDNASLGGPSAANTYEPRFIDPGRGDYRLKASSGAVDAAPAVGGSDAYARPYDVDLPIKVNYQGPRDIGAFERQSLQPIVLNGDFDFSDLRYWSLTAGAWDATENAVGASGSGSWKFSTSGQTAVRFNVGQQCVHLPGPGRYRLTGRGKGGGNTMITRDYALVAWDFRRAGTEACTGGAVDRSGEMTLGSGSAWVQPAQPAVIDVSAAEWGYTSSITLRLIAQDGGVSIGGSVTAWFDGITLEADDDVIFANGFQ